MKRTEQFTRTIAEYLNQRAMTDPLFAPNLQKPHKNIEDCITYILKQVQQSGCCGFEDNEIYSMAVHYYDEDDLEVGIHLALPHQDTELLHRATATYCRGDSCLCRARTQ